MSSTLGYAQNSDGTLRDASEIQFYHDVDDDQPMPAASKSTVRFGVRPSSNAEPNALNPERKVQVQRSGKKTQGEKHARMRTGEVQEDRICCGEAMDAASFVHGGRKKGTRGIIFDPRVDEYVDNLRVIYGVFVK
ncbi:hypothetical protein B0H13DRAFT_1851971 [Mycena leptocephala]|nr:hypothetical protein B0H13DRAFT_1851971 [Mycena leptocephala]